MCQGPQAVLDVDFPRRGIVLTEACWILSSHSGRVNRPQATTNPEALDVPSRYHTTPGVRRAGLLRPRPHPETRRHLARFLWTFGSPQNTTQLYFIPPTVEDEAHPSCKGASQRLLSPARDGNRPPQNQLPPPSSQHPPSPRRPPPRARPSSLESSPPIAPSPPQARRVAKREP